LFSIFKPLAGGYSGLALAVTIALCAGFLSEHYGAPVMLFALLVGMAFNFWPTIPNALAESRLPPSRCCGWASRCLGFG
jgi:uncharacterized membrane protein YadS